MASQASDDTTSNHVPCLVDGEVVNTHPPRAGTPITGDAVELRLRQQSKLLEHFNLIFMSTEDTAKRFVNQQEAVQEQHDQDLREAIRQSNEARGSEFTHLANVTIRTEEIEDLTKDRDKLKDEVDQLNLTHSNEDNGNNSSIAFQGFQRAG